MSLSSWGFLCRIACLVTQCLLGGADCGQELIVEQCAEENVCAPPQSTYEKHFGVPIRYISISYQGCILKCSWQLAVTLCLPTLNRAPGGHLPPEGTQIVNSGTRLPSSAGLERGCSLARGKQQDCEQKERLLCTQ